MSQRFAGRYELVDHLGDGGAGSVWRAWDARRERYVAAKLLRQRDAGALLRFVREQSMRVAHPHVVAPTGWAAEDDDVLLTMDLVRGGSLATLLGDYGRLSPAVVAVLLDQLLDALQAVHAAGLVHRDVKPSNLLLEPTGLSTPVLRLADFGIAVLPDEPRLTHTGFVMGTVGYVAPEVLKGADPDARQDVWSAGVVGLQMLTGERPGPAAYAGAHEIAPQLVHWLETLTHPDPDQRPGAAAARASLARIPLPDREDDEPVEVFDQLPALPQGWTSVGPRQGVLPDPASRDVPVQASSPGATAALTAELAAGRGGAGQSGGVGTAAVRAGAGPVGQQGRLVGSDGGAPAAPAPDARQPARPPARRGSVLRVATALALLVLAALLFTRALQGEAPVPAPAGLPTTTARPGDACAFSEVDERRAADGEQITCRQVDGGYRWTSG